MATSAMMQHALAPIASLRNINAHVGTTLADLAAKGLKTPLPRQASGHAHPAVQPASFGELTLGRWTFLRTSTLKPDHCREGQLPDKDSFQQC